MGGIFLFFAWFLARIWKNFGVVEKKKLYRSGQLGPLRLLVTYYTIKPNVVISLNINSIRPSSLKGILKSWKEEFEIWFLMRRRNLVFCFHSFSSSGNTDPERFEVLLELLLDSLRRKKRVWVHCAGGKDRTGGMIGSYIARSGKSFSKFVTECFLHKIPYDGWMNQVLEDYKKLPLQNTNTQYK